MKTWEWMGRTGVFNAFAAGFVLTLAVINLFDGKWLRAIFDLALVGANVYVYFWVSKSNRKYFDGLKHYYDATKVILHQPEPEPEVVNPVVKPEPVRTLVEPKKYRDIDL